MCLPSRWYGLWKRMNLSWNPPGEWRHGRRLPSLPGMTYRTMDADNRICHRNYLGRLPDGATLIKTYSRYTYDQRTLVTEHEYEIMVYRDKDGNYTIDNSLAERCIRPLANERKNSLFFGCDRMARVSATYSPSCPLAGFRGIQSWNTSKSSLPR